MIGTAFERALTAHKGQTDKSGQAYIGHVVRVAAAVEGEAQTVVALLHDVVEDCDVTLDQIRAEFGDKIAKAVDAITRRDGEAPGAYYARIAANALALPVKLADIADNSNPARLALLPDETRHRLEQKYAKALHALGAHR